MGGEKAKEDDKLWRTNREKTSGEKNSGGVG